MEDRKIIGRESISGTFCELQEDGYWKVISEINDNVLYEYADGKTEWVKEKVDAKALDTDCQKAIQTAMNSTLGYLLDNVYKKGFSGLIELREYERRLNDSKVESPTNS